MILYKYDKDTKEYLGYFSAYIDPLESIKQNREIYVIPPCSTSVIPPKLKEGCTFVFDTNKNVWEELEDHRGLICWDKNGKEVTITKLGAISEELSLKKPFTLEEMKDKKVREVNSKYLLAYRERVKIGDINVCIDEAVKLKNSLITFGDFGSFIFDETLVKPEEAERALKFLYIRSILLLEKKKELLNIIANSKSIEEVEKINIEYILEIEKCLDLSMEELREKLSS